MGHEEQDLLLSAYLDGELEPELADRLEEELENDPELQERLHKMAAMGSSLREHLYAEAEAQDFSAMRAAVMEEIGATAHAPAYESEETWIERGIESLRQLFRQPAMSFALGVVVVLGAWMAFQNLGIEATSPEQNQVSAEIPLSSRSAPLEENASDHGPDLVVDELETLTGTVELRTRPDDPEAPTVLWYVATGGAE